MNENIYNFFFILILMCKLCKTKPVYEFTNQRKLCARCFVKYFQKKFLYTIRKFKMIDVKEDRVALRKGKDFRSVVLEDVLKMFCEKSGVELRSLRSPLDGSQLAPPNCSLKKLLMEKNFKWGDLVINNLKKFRAERGKSKLAIPSTIDTQANKFLEIVINKKAENLKELSPVIGKIIKPLCLFLDEEVLLYVKLRKLKYSDAKEEKTKISVFLDGIEKKHPEVKRAIMNYYLKLYG